MKKLLISVCLAVHNEEENIKRCLSSVYSWVDEIIIVDGQSTDKTVAVARALGKKVHIYKYDNPPMFHINKQRALLEAHGEWILQLDADEVVSKELRKEIEQIVHNDKKENKLVAYWIPRLNFFLGSPLKKGGQYPDYTIRFYKNGAARLPCKSVHEQAEVVGGARVTGYLSANILHYPYKNFSDYIRKWDRYCRLEVQLMYERRMRPSTGLFVQYMIIKPLVWFFATYFRHRGFVDGFPGFVFSLFSALRFWLIYIELYEQYAISQRAGSP